LCANAGPQAIDSVTRVSSRVEFIEAEFNGTGVRSPYIEHAAANRDQDRYVMITFPTSQIQNPVLPRRPSIRHG
jgi:hypothetical protein